MLQCCSLWIFLSCFLLFFFFFFVSQEFLSMDSILFNLSHACCFPTGYRVVSPFGSCQASVHSWSYCHAIAIILPALRGTVVRCDAHVHQFDEPDNWLLTHFPLVYTLLFWSCPFSLENSCIAGPGIIEEYHSIVHWHHHPSWGGPTVCFGLASAVKSLPSLSPSSSTAGVWAHQLLVWAFCRRLPVPLQTFLLPPLLHWTSVSYSFWCCSVSMVCATSLLSSHFHHGCGNYSVHHTMPIGLHWAAVSSIGDAFNCVWSQKKRDGWGGGCIVRRRTTQYFGPLSRLG